MPLASQSSLASALNSVVREVEFSITVFEVNAVKTLGVENAGFQGFGGRPGRVMHNRAQIQVASGRHLNGDAEGRVIDLVQIVSV